MIEAHLEKLRSFHLAAQAGSLAEAASRLRLTQPAITKSIRALEDQLGTKLFTRHRRGVELTRAGTLLEEFCEGLFAKVRDVEKKIQNTGEMSGVIRIGTYETLGAHFWPKVLRRIGEKYPDLAIELVTENSSTLWSRLESESLDLIVDAEPRTAEHLFSRVIYTDYFGLFCRKRSRFLKMDGRLPISYVRKAIDRQGTPIEAHLRKTSLSFELLYDVESFTWVRSLLLEDVCLGVLPVSLGAWLVSDGQAQYFGKPRMFGEHRICVSSLERVKNEPKIVELTKFLKLFIPGPSESRHGPKEP